MSLSVEEIGFERGLKAGKAEGIAEGKAEGIAEGRLEAERKLLKVLLGKKFGDLPEACEEAIARLASEQLEQLTLLVLELEAIAALEDWLTEAMRSQIVDQLSEKLESTPNDLEAAVANLSLQKLLTLKVLEVSSINDLK